MIPHQQLKTLFITLGILLLNLSVVVVQGDYHSNANTNANLDKLDNCQELALDGKCETDLENMKKNCHQTCQQRTEEKLQFRLIKLQESFYDLSATKATAGTGISTSKSSSSVIDFERFEGYVTLIIPLAKLCSQHMAVTPKSIFESIEKLKELYSYSLEVLVFPYEHPSVSAAAEAAIANGDTDANINNDCSEFESLMVQDRSSSKKKKGSNNRQIYVFEESNLKQKKIKPTKGDDNSNEEEEEDEETVIPVHPVFQYFLDEMGMEELPFDTQFYFIVLPDGDKAYFQYGKSLLDIQDIVSELVRSLGGKEL